MTNTSEPYRKFFSLMKQPILVLDDQDFIHDLTSGVEELFEIQSYDYAGHRLRDFFDWISGSSPEMDRLIHRESGREFFIKKIVEIDTNMTCLLLLEFEQPAIPRDVSILVENILSPVILLSSESKILKVNSACAGLLGVSDSQFAAEYLLNHCFPDYTGEWVNDSFFRFPQKRSLFLNRPDGESLLLDLTSQNIQSSDMTGPFYVCSFLARTEQRRISEDDNRWIQKLGASVDDAGIGYWTYFPESETFKGTRVFFSLFDLDIEDKKDIPLDLLHKKVSKEDQRRFSALFTQGKDLGKGFIHEFKLILAKGMFRVIQFKITNINSRIGEESQVSGIIQDITENKQAISALMISEERYRRIIQDQSEYIVRFDVDFRLSFINESFHKFVGRERYSLFGINFLDFFIEKKRAGIREKIESVSFDNPSVTFESELMNNEGDVSWHRWTVRAIFGENRDLLEFQSVGLDITMRKVTELALQESEERYRILIDNADDMIALYDLEQEEYVVYNEAFVEHLGASGGSQGIKDVFNSINPDGLPLNVKDFENLFQLRKIESEFFLKGSKGSWRSLSSRCVFIPSEGHHKGYILFIIRDITELKQTENALRKAKEQAEESDQLKSAFLANMSHEIRTPLNAIIGFSRLLATTKTTGEQQNKYMNIIESNSSLLMTLISDIIDISKIETGAVDLFPERFSIPLAFEEIYNNFSQQIERTGPPPLTLKTVSLLSDDQAFITTDKARFIQILTNLISNAIKFTHYGGIEFGYQKPKKDTITFYVKDTGIGISKEMGDVIFDRFRQAEVGNSRRYGGTGLGLAICKSFIEKMGGVIWVESSKDKGSTFFFTLPWKWNK